MLPPGNMRILVCTEPVNMLNSFEGLSSLVQKMFSMEITAGAFFVFINRVQDRMKVLYWDTDGLAIWYKRLERGHFIRNGKPLLNRREFLMLLEGITPKSLQKRYTLN
jgi:transposase